MSNFITIAEWSKSIGISRQQGYEAVKRCEIPVNDGKVDSSYATHLYNNGTRKRAGGKQGDAAGSLIGSGVGEASEYLAARARRESAEASIAEMKEAEMRGKYLVKSDVDAAFFEVARALRDGLTNCAKRLAADVASLSTTDECETVIEREHRALLESMAARLKAKLDVVEEETFE